MLDVVTLPAVAAFAGAYPATAEVVAQRRETVEPVVRAKPVGARRPSQPLVPLEPVPEGDARPLRATAARDHERGAAGRSAPPADGTLARPSTAFIAQYIGQVLVPEVGLEERESAAALAYRATAERGVTYFGFEAPIDLSV